MIDDQRRMQGDKKQKVIIVLATMLTLSCRVAGAESLTEADLVVLDRPADTMMRDYLTAIIDEQLAQRTSMLAPLKSAEDWNRHAAFIRGIHIGMDGSFS